MLNAMEPATGKPATMKRMAAQVGVGGVYRALHDLQTRSWTNVKSPLNAKNPAGRQVEYAAHPQRGQTVLIGKAVVTSPSTSGRKSGSSIPSLDVPQFQHTSKDSSTDSWHFLHSHTQWLRQKPAEAATTTIFAGRI